MLNGMVEDGLDGIECYQPAHSEKDAEWLVRFSEENTLLITGGSDWHGSLETVGNDIKGFIPDYIDKLGDFSMPVEYAEKVLQRIQI